MADDKREITPAEDPYEFDWPDDAKEARAAERAEAAAKADVKPAPLWLTEITVGIATVLAFIFPVTVVAGNAVPPFIELVLLVVLGGVTVGLIPALILKPIIRGWRRGLPELAAVVVGFVVGAAWTWLFLTWQAAPDPVRVRISVFMGTAVAAAYYVALAWSQKIRTAPRAVFATAGVIGLLTVASIVVPLLPR